MKLYGAMAISLGMVGVAEAATLDFGENIYLDLGANSYYDSNFANVDTDGRTDEFTQIGWAALANSLYDISGGASATSLDAGDKVWDVSSGSINQLTNYYPSNPAIVTSTDIGANAGEGFGASWNLTFDYTLNGVTAVVDGSGVPQFANFSGGVMNVYFNSLNSNEFASQNGKKVLQMNVDSFGASFGSQTAIFINGLVDYSFLASTDAFVENFFNFAGVGSTAAISFYDLWLAGQPAVLPIEFRIQTETTDNAQPTLGGAQTIINSVPGIDGPSNTLYEGTASTWKNVADEDLVGRSTQVTPGVRFQRVPEPSTVMLLGIGLLGMASRALRKSS